MTKKDHDTYPDMILRLPTSANGSWQPHTNVQFPEFNPERYTARDPDPELYHPFAYAVDCTGGRGFFVRGWVDHPDSEVLTKPEEEVWARISKEDWDRARSLFLASAEFLDEDYHETVVEGVLANFEFQRVHVVLDPMTEHGEIQVSVRYLDAA